MFWDRFFKKKIKYKDVAAEGLISEDERKALEEADTKTAGEEANYNASLGLDKDIMDYLQNDTSFMTNEKLEEAFNEGSNLYVESDEEEIDKDIPVDKIDELSNMFKRLEDNQDLQKEISGKFAETQDLVIEGDIDSRIEELLRKDELEEEQVENIDVSTEFIGQIQVFDTEEPIVRGPIPEETEEKEEKKGIFDLLSIIPQKTLYIVSAAMITLIVVFGVATFMLSRGINKRQAEAIIIDARKITQPKDKGTGGNYIFITQEKSFKDGKLTLQKMLIDKMSTVFYFDKYIEAEKYDITLVDENNIYYNLNLSFLGNEKKKDEFSKAASALYFEPFSPDTRSFTLTIKDSVSKESVAFTMVLDSKINFLPVRYLDTPINLMEDKGGVSAKVDTIALSDAGSIVNYSLKWDDESKIQLGNDDDTENIELLELGRKILPAKEHPNEYVFKEENSIIGRMDFEPLKNLSSEIEVVFKNLYEKVDLNEDVDTASLFLNREGSEVIYHVGSYKIVLERLGKQGYYYVLVFHTEDDDVFAVSSSGKNADNRINTQIEAQLVLVTSSGEQVVLDGLNRSTQEGTDMLFDTRPVEQLIKRVPNSSIQLRIGSVLFKMKDISVPIQLDKAMTTKSKEGQKLENFIIEAFEQRLLYKSGAIEKNGITGFSKYLMGDDLIMSDYEPVENAKDAKFSAQIVTYTQNAENSLAVVREIWKHPVDDSIAFYRTHRIVINNTPSGWEIGRDDVIR